MATTISEVLSLRWLLKEFKVYQSSPTSLYCDNQAACHIALNLVSVNGLNMSRWTAISYESKLKVAKSPPLCPTNLQVADIFTKALGADRFRFL